MDWVNLLDRAVFLRGLFPSAPDLRSVRIHEIRFHQDGPVCLLRFDLNEFPQAPPPKWIQSEANQVQVTVGLLGVRTVRMEGWTTDNLADIAFSRAPEEGIAIAARADGLVLEGLFDSAYVESVTAYFKNRRTD
jgi:hypothetical protein